MTLVLDKLRQLLPSRAKTSPSGWISFNAPCCHHRGQNRDTRKRGGVKFSDGFTYNCFNCKFTASWSPGRPVSNKLKSLLKWMNASDDDINKIIFEALKTESPDYTPAEFVTQVTFTEKTLPEGSLPIVEWLQCDLDTELESQLALAVQYVFDRGYDPTDPHFYWTPVEGFNNRVIIPFLYQNKVVGFTARKVTNGRPKYISEQHPHFVFNLDRQTKEQKYTLITEGPFDAIAVNGVALLTNGIGDQQARLINDLGTTPIVIPDQDKAGLAVIDRAVELGWAVAFPNWEDDVKDCADAVQKYGKLFVVVDAIETAQQGAIKIEVAKKHLEAKIKRIEASQDAD